MRSCASARKKLRNQNEVPPCILCPLRWLVHALAMDREAFTFTNYNLDVRIEPDQQRLAARGKITLRNDSASPRKTGTSNLLDSGLEIDPTQRQTGPVRLATLHL